MKKILLLFLILLTSVTLVVAQTYSINKRKYDCQEYKKQPGDPYSPIASGICSFFVPGLGQIICGESSRGLSFLGASTGCLLITGTGAILLLDSWMNGMGGQNTTNRAFIGTLCFLGGLAGMVTFDIWSIVDAVKVAKVKNMYFQDTKKDKYGIELAPYLEYFSINNQAIVPVGITLKLRF